MITFELSDWSRVPEQLEFNPTSRGQARSGSWPPRSVNTSWAEPWGRRCPGTPPACVRPGPVAQVFSSPGLGLTTSQANPAPHGGWGWLHPRATVAVGRIWPHRPAERPLGGPSLPLLAWSRHPSGFKGQFHLLPEAAPALHAVTDGVVHGAPPCGALEDQVFMSTQPHLASGTSCLYSCLPEPQWAEAEGLVYWKEPRWKELTQSQALPCTSCARALIFQSLSFLICHMDGTMFPRENEDGP